jgi:hypothetical protein
LYFSIVFPMPLRFCSKCFSYGFSDC